MSTGSTPPPWVDVVLRLAQRTLTQNRRAAADERVGI